MSSTTVVSDLGRVRAIARRDLDVFVSYRLQLIMRLVSSGFMVVGLFFMDRLVGESPALAEYAGRYFEFALIGVVLVQFVNVGLGAFSATISGEQRGGTLEVVLATPSRITTLLGGMFVFPLVNVAAFVVVYLTTGVMLLGARFQPAGILPALVVLALTVAVFCAVGGLSGALIVLTKRGDPIGALAAQAAVLLGGAVFPVSVLPDWLASVAQVLPPFYALQALRATLIEGAGFGDIWGDIVVLGAFAVTLLPLSLWVFARALRRARIMGTLGNY